jgi:hypothetical protein
MARQGNKVVIWTGPNDGEDGEAHKDMVATSEKEGLGNSSKTARASPNAQSGPNAIERWKLKKELERDKQTARRTSIQAMTQRRQSVDYQTGISEIGLEPLVEEDDPIQPLPMVCFPPPGYVPLDWIDPRALWTIFPDPRRYQPSPGCMVHVFRVKLELLSFVAERIEHVPLREFRIDCSQVGSPLCIAFQPDIDYFYPGDRFEVVIEGLTGENSPPQGEALSYYFILDEFRPRGYESVRGALRNRCIAFCENMRNPAAWGLVKGFMPSDVQQDTSDKHSRRSSVRAARLMASSGQGFAEKACPPLGIIYYPDMPKGPLGQDNQINIKICGSYLTIVLLVPSEVFIRGNIAGFSKGDAKWIPFNRLVNSTSMHTDDDGPYDRVILDVLIPLPGRFELTLKWAIVPKEIQACRTLNLPSSNHPSYDHPLSFQIQASADESQVQLLPTLTHQLTGCIGFPPKHPMAERFGVTLLAPQRFRLRIGLVHFVVHCTDESGVYMSFDEKHALEVAARQEAKEDAAAMAAMNGGGRSKRLAITSDMDDGKGSSLRHSQGRKFSTHTRKKPAGGIAAEDIKEACFRHGKKEGARSLSFEQESRTLDLMSNMQQGVLQAMGQRTQDANVGPVSVAVVVGNWRRVEWLKPQPRLPGTARQGPEVQEAVIRFGDDDQNQAVSLVVLLTKQILTHFA